MTLTRLLRLVAYSIWIVLPIIACDMPDNYGVVTLPFIFTTTNGEDHFWTLEVKPNSLYEISIKGTYETDARGELSILTETLECAICDESVSGNLGDGLVIYVLPKTSQLTIKLFGYGGSPQASLNMHEVSQSEATTIAMPTPIPTVRPTRTPEPTIILPPTSVPYGPTNMGPR